jgi:hypothetical protein
MRPIRGGLCATCGRRWFSPYAFARAPSKPGCGLCRRVELAFASEDRQMQMEERIGADDVPMAEAVGI